MSHFLDLGLELLDKVRIYICSLPTFDSNLASYELDDQSFPTLHFPHKHLSFFQSELRNNRELTQEKQWRAVLNTTKLLSEVKRITAYYTLANSSALDYLSEKEFRVRVDQLVRDRQRQLRISVNSCIISQRNYFHWDGAHAIFLSRQYSPLDFAAFSNVINLSFFRCNSIPFIANLPRLRQLSVFECSALTSIANLPALMSLHVDDCELFQELSIDQPLRFLGAYRCPNFIITKRLQSLIKIQIYLGFYDPEDFEDGRVLTTSESPLTVITRKEFYTGFQTLYAIHLEGILYEIDCSLFRSVRDLCLAFCPMLRSIQHLRYLRILRVKKCDSFQELDFSSLPFLTHASLIDCPELRDLSIKSPPSTEMNDTIIHKLFISLCCNLRQIEIFRSVALLDLFDLDTLHPTVISIQKPYPIPRILAGGLGSIVMNIYKR